MYFFSICLINKIKLFLQNNKIRINIFIILLLFNNKFSENKLYIIVNENKERFIAEIIIKLFLSLKILENIFFKLLLL